ncbi:PAS/PAC sensor signal transduction histidine kinase [Natronococcus amylolyticus DSM 10524]|uniref:histidine kinase n=1 Tax=Natronococcus amylolyticus DSM 10524 TaxID=1227497 RepID=L9WYV5_9EURY|nr:PAS domain-containing protein [Natronococcus amylolyticus]ELY53508.1 PAS/PAC sensor signal transduction histidine kinase [Natronococcus amylolyticus DSM 10524]
MSEWNGIEMAFWDGAVEGDAHRRYRTLHHATGDGVFQLDVEGRFAAVNDTVREITGYGYDDLLGEPIATVLETDGSAIEREIERLRAEPETRSALLEVPVTTANEEPVLCEVRVHPFNGDDSLWGAVGTVREISRRNRTELDWQQQHRDFEYEGESYEITRDLQESEERLRLALQAGGLGMWELDLQTRESPVRSPKHDRIFGYEEPREDWSFEIFLEHVYPDDREFVERSFEEAFETGTWEFDCRIVRADDERRWITAQGEFYYDTDGEPVRAIGVVQDVTEQKENAKSLEDATARLEAATEAGAVGTWEWHVPDDRMVVGASFAEQFGVDPDAAREGVPLEQFVSSIHEADRERVRKKIETAVETCGEYEAEYRVRNADDEFRWVVARGHVECDEDGNALTFPGTLTDITERKRAELEAEDQSRQLETLFQVLPVGAVVADGNGSVLRANDVARDIWGGDVFDVESVDEYDKYPAEWADTGERVDPEEWTMAQVLRGDSVTDPNVYEIRAFDGERRIIMEHGKPVKDANGEVIRAIVTLTDITERKTYEQRLEESNERLEQFAYAASHDLQEPLRMVTSYLELLERQYGDDLDADGEEFLEFAVDGADRMREMIDALLEYARVDTRDEPFEPVELDAVLEDVRETLRMKIDESEAEIEAESLPRVRGDPAQLRQLLQNLLSNAIEYSGEGAPRIQIETERTGTSWRVAIHDEGVGIDVDKQAQVFDVFERLHSQEEHPGTGIGLALCKRIVERHGGEISVESEPGEGATFAFTLPAA